LKFKNLKTKYSQILKSYSVFFSLTAPKLNLRETSPHPNF